LDFHFFVRLKLSLKKMNHLSAQITENYVVIKLTASVHVTEAVIIVRPVGARYIYISQDLINDCSL
jgi:hypothetical protein